MCVWVRPPKLVVEAVPRVVVMTSCGAGIALRSPFEFRGGCGRCLSIGGRFGEQGGSAHVTPCPAAARLVVIELSAMT